MKVVVVYAHPNPNSFNHAVLESFTKGLEQGGNTFEVIDLYATKFNPVLRLDDLTQFASGQVPQDVLDQQAKLAQADGLAFIFPIWWLSCPAVFKGWIDRVLTEGFAYRFAEMKRMEGLLKAKKVLLINTTGGPEQKYNASGEADMIKTYFHEIFKGTCSNATVEHVFLYGLDLVGEEARKQIAKPSESDWANPTQKSNKNKRVLSRLSQFSDLALRHQPT